jgi:hypothetical protein
MQPFDIDDYEMWLRLLELEYQVYTAYTRSRKELTSES